MYYFLFALSLLFIALKLTGYIAWSWWLVLMPLYLLVQIVFVIVLILAMLILSKTSPYA